MVIAQLLAILALHAYGGAAAAGLPANIQPTSLAGVETSRGCFNSGNAAAVVANTSLGGRRTLVVTFRGAADAKDWRTDLRDINLAYARFQPLVRAIEAYAGGGGRVLLVGHSQGGAMAQIFMYTHQGQDRYRAVTFGSPGARPQLGVFGAAEDSRITNYVVSDDPFVFLGEHRAEVVRHALRHPVYALLLALGIAQESGVPLPAVLLQAIRPSVNYLNNGATVRLSGARDAVTVRSVVAVDPDEHDAETYAKLLRAQSVAAPALW